jgi:hypothetical protein
VDAALFVQMFHARYTSATLKAASFLTLHFHRLFDGLAPGCAESSRFAFPPPKRYTPGRVGGACDGDGRGYIG